MKKAYLLCFAFLITLSNARRQQHHPNIKIDGNLNYDLKLIQDDGLARTPPMGWRSWNCYGGEVTDTIMRKVVDMMVMKKYVINGVPTSIVDLGYKSCGLDDNWQQCGAGVEGTFHEASGVPIINKNRFPDLKAFNDYAHSKGVKTGWYHNNCICSEGKFPNIPAHYQGDVNSTVLLDFDEVKLDGCGIFRDLDLWSQLYNKSGRPMVIENCHWGGDLPTVDHCPYHFYRTSGDISPSWSSFYSNLQSTKKFQDADAPLSRPGCWAYPDMLEVGNMGDFAEERAHFGAWCVVSAPLILGFDLNNGATMDRVWPIISNKEAIAINQAWFGHPGRLVEEYNPNPNSTDLYSWAVKCSSDADQQGWSFDSVTGQIKKNGKCMDSVTKNELSLRDCSGAATQKWTFGSDGTFKATTGDCMDIYNFEGPSVELYGCNYGCNQKFTLTNGVLKDMCAPPDHATLCIAARDNKPNGGDLIQIWAKKVSAAGAQAVLVLNSDQKQSNHVITIDLARVGLNGTVTVRDVWAKSTIGTATGKFVTDAVPGYDSRFYVFTPQ